MAFRGNGTSKKQAGTKLIISTVCGLLLGLSIGYLLVRLGVPSLSRGGNGALVISSRAPSSDSSLRASDCPYATESSDRPRGTEGLPPGIIVAETDLYQRRLWGDPKEDLLKNPSKYLITLTVGIKQKQMVNLTVSKFPREWTFMLFHYDGNTDDWDEFPWSRTAIHVSAKKQTKWWYAKRFLHPDVVTPYDYIFIWDEDLGVENFDAQKYIDLVQEHGLEISQPALNPLNASSWEITKRRVEGEVHKTAVEKPGWCTDPHRPPCAGFVEIMAPVFSRKAWRCVWHLIQNDLVHGWGLDFNMRRCVEPAHEKIGVVDAQWIEHLGVPSLGDQGMPGQRMTSREAVRHRCYTEWDIFEKRISLADYDGEDEAEETRQLSSQSYN